MTPDETLQLAVQYHQAGDFQHAEYSYKEILKIQPDNFHALHYLGVLYYQTKKYDLAVTYIELALQSNPHDSNAYYNLGIVFKEKGQLDQAITCYQNSLRYNPANADAYVNLGIVFLERGEFDEAITCFQKALQLNPDLIPAHYNLGHIFQTKSNLDKAIPHYKKAIELNPKLINAYMNLGLIFYDKRLFDEAIKYYQTALQFSPDSADAYNNLGVVFKENGQLDKAIACYQKALQINPNLPDAYNGSEPALKEKGQFDEAIACYQKALQLNPEFPDAYNNLGVVLKEKGQFDEAIACYQKSLRLNPNLHDPYNNLGIVFKEKGQLDEAIAYFKKALQFNPDSPDAYNGLGVVLQEKGQFDEAISSYRKALQINQNYADAYNNLGNAFQAKGQFDQAELNYRHAIEIKPDFVSCYSNLLFVMNYNSGYNAETIFSEHLQFAKRFEEPLLSAIPSHKNDRSLSRRLKIGYVSPDFKRHPVANLIEPVLAAHNKEQFEVFCYSLVHKEDEVTKCLQGYADHWRNIAGMSDEKAAELIRNDGIDILVDLTGHTAYNRMLLFSRKPAPVQVTWIGYLATTGLSSIDYRIADMYTDPPSMTEHFYTEKLLRLPESFWCYLPDKDSPEVSKLPALTAGQIAFGSFNNFAKVSHEVISAWSKILQAVPNSQLVLKAFNLFSSTNRQNIMDMFTQRGITSERIVLLSWEKSPRHLESYNLVDIGLDTFPFNGGVTTCEALWMGVPVITLAGTAYHSRVGISLLSNVGLPDLVAKTLDEYISIAVNLANDLDRLQSLRERLRDMMSHSPLCDAKKFTANLEKCFHQIWETWCKSDQVR